MCTRHSSITFLKKKAYCALTLCNYESIATIFALVKRKGGKSTQLVSLVAGEELGRDFPGNGGVFVLLRAGCPNTHF